MAQVAVMSPNGEVNKIDKDSAESAAALRQMAALMLKAVLADKYDGIRVGDAVAEDDQFWVDSDKDDQQVSADELEGLEADIKKLAKNDAKVDFVERDGNDALGDVKNDKFSTELINDHAKNGKVAMYNLGNAYAVAEAPILVYGDVVKNFKLLSVAGAYWKGMSSNPMLQRIYVTALFKKEDLA